MTDLLFAAKADPETGWEASRSVVGGFRDAESWLAENDLPDLVETGLIQAGDEVAALEYIARYTSTEYDRVVFDSAPTGHTLQRPIRPLHLLRLSTSITVGDAP